MARLWVRAGATHAEPLGFALTPVTRWVPLHYARPPRIMKRPAGFSAIATADAARASASVRQIASVSSPYTRLSGLGG
jgi:hypothetical protein